MPASVLQTSPQYTPLRQDEEPRAAVRSSSNHRWLVVVGFGVLAVLYLGINVREAAGTMRSGKTEISVFPRYEKHKLVTENADLKAKLAALEAQLSRRDTASMERARAAAGRFDNTLMQVAGGNSAVAAAPSSRDAAASSTPTLQQTLASALKPPMANRTGALDVSRYRLTPELVRSRCNTHNIILVTFVNSKRADYGYTWAAHVRRLGLSNYLVGAMDSEALRKLVAREIPAFDMESGLTTADYGWGTKNFRQLGLRKTELIINLLRAGADPILTDADALITRDPTPFIARLLPEVRPAARDTPEIRPR